MVNSETAPLLFRMKKNVETSSTMTTKEAAALQNTITKIKDDDDDGKKSFSFSSSPMLSHRGLSEKISIRARALSRTLKWKETTYKNIGNRNKFRNKNSNNVLWMTLIFLAMLSAIAYFYLSGSSPIETPAIMNSTTNNQTLDNGGKGDHHYLGDNLLLSQQEQANKLKQLVGLYNFYKNEKDHAVNAEVVKELTSPTCGEPHFTYMQPFQHLVSSHETPRNLGCRPFSSVVGNLTLEFKSGLRRIKAIAYAHMDPDLTSAPKEIEIYTITKNPDNEQRHHHDYTKFNNLLSIIKRFVTRTKYSAPFHDFQFIANFTHTIDQMPLQIFEIPSTAQPSTGIRYLLFSIKSNWGNEITCLSRFRVYGELIGGGGIDGD
ncbi:7732_t:CDS:2 [Ambispora gerdemannii]|uniref:7732_t:CDS:1 n=1 Tax=Ambispora gerdemannii TaxID=144530 RepID=A0A9N9AGZ7_9GLOM|nr:7732_t:CDS:2 [Ambispora gerdemannii]